MFSTEICKNIYYIDFLTMFAKCHKSVEEVFCDVVALVLPLRSIFVVVQGQKMKP